METFWAVVTFLTGLVVGSFLNVVIYRLPRGQNLSTPRSRCPGCGQQIAWYDNIPLLSWLLLRAKCRGCGTAISARYPFIELLTGVLFLLAWWELGPAYATVAIVCLYLSCLVAGAWIDIDHQIIPDAITLRGMVVFFALAPLNGLLTHEYGFKPGLNAYIHSGAGILVGTGVVFLIRLVGTPIWKKEPMGLGDLKLLGLIGAVVGPLQVLYSIAIASFAGAVVGGSLVLLAKLRALPCELAVEGPDGLSAEFDRLHFGGEGGVQFVVAGAPAAAEGTEVDLRLGLSYQRVLTDDDVELKLKGRIARTKSAGGDAYKWWIETYDVSEQDNRLLWLFKGSRSLIKFGPFLAIGGAATALYGEHVHWFLTEGYPLWIRSLME